MVFQTVGINLYFCVNQWIIKSEIETKIKNSLSANELEEIPASKVKTIQWFDENELIFEGKMYDIVQQKTDHHGEVIYLCLNDEKEKDLYTKVEKQTSQESNKKIILLKGVFEFQCVQNNSSFIFELQSTKKEKKLISYSNPTNTFHFQAKMKKPPKA